MTSNISKSCTFIVFMKDFFEFIQNDCIAQTSKLKNRSWSPTLLRVTSRNRHLWHVWKGFQKLLFLVGNLVVLMPFGLRDMYVNTCVWWCMCLHISYECMYYAYIRESDEVEVTQNIRKWYHYRGSTNRKWQRPQNSKNTLYTKFLRRRNHKEKC